MLSLDVSIDDLLHLDEILDRQIKICADLTPDSTGYSKQDLEDYSKWALALKTRISDKLLDIAN